MTNNSSSSDAWEHLPDLEAASANPALAGCDEPDFVPGPDFPAAAYELAVALGFVRVYGVEAGDLDGTLPPNVAVAAGKRLIERLAAARSRLEKLGDEWDAAEDEIVGDALIYEILDADLEAWAVLEVLIESVREGGSLESCRQTLEAKVSYTAWQEALQAEMGLLSTVAGTNYIVNIRNTLAHQYRDTAPWWLGPDLDEAAAEERRQAVATLPRIPRRA